MTDLYRDDGGFTLIELLLATSIMLVIIVPLTGAFVLGLGTANGSLQDTTNSTDEQVLAGFFDTDVVNAEQVATTSTCGSSGTAVLGLSWTDGAQAVKVAYRAVPDPAAQADLAVPFPIDRLDRVRCVNGAVVDTQQVARSVIESTGVQVTCDAAAVGTCSATTPRRITMTAVEQTPQLADAGSNGRFTISVTASRKVTP